MEAEFGFIVAKSQRTPRDLEPSFQQKLDVEIPCLSQEGQVVIVLFVLQYVHCINRIISTV